MLLFVYNRNWEIFSNEHKDLFSLQLKKQTQASAFLTIFSHQWKRKKDQQFFAKPLQTIEGKQHEIVQWKKFWNHSFCSHCSGEAKPQMKIM